MYLSATGISTMFQGVEERLHRRAGTLECDPGPTRNGESEDLVRGDARELYPFVRFFVVASVIWFA